MCTIIIVNCSWDGLLEGRNSFCVWLIWCSELCSVDQTVTVQRGSVLDVRGPEWFCQPFCSLTQAVRTTLRSLLRSDLVAELWMCRGRIQWWQSRTFSAAPVAGWTSSAGEGSTTSAGSFSQWSLCDCPTSGPGTWWCPGTWMTPLQSQCCPWWRVSGFSWSPRSLDVQWLVYREKSSGELSPEELQWWLHGCWMCIFPASLAAACLSESCWSTDRWRRARRVELVWSGGGLGW